MLGSGQATATLQNTSATNSPTRPSRLRGLSYSLRNYTHNHLHASSPSRAEQQQQRQQQQPPASPRSERPSPRRSISYPTESTSPNAATARSGSQSGIHSREGGWVPTVQGRSGLSRQAVDLTSTDTQTAQRETSQSPESMTRARAATVVAPLAAGASTDAAMPSTSSTAQGGKESLPTIRFIPHVETRSTRPSLHFQAVSRTLKNASTIVRVGRYSERDSPTAEDNTLPVGFKSKVVSRRHCEFWCASGQWYVKDVKSSSGTFLNHVRLSSPGVESRPYPVNDGDVVQLGIDFKGGEEVIFRCVKIRVECNRGWQKSLNNFNTSTHKRLLKTAGVSKSRDSDAASVNTSECSICLNPVAPCQALFVAPCSHVWHYKCVRNLIHGPNWPNFLCPNCRFVADLEADVEPPEEEEEEFEEIADFQDAEEGLDPDQSGETGVSSDDAVGSSNGNGGDAGNLTDDSTTTPRTPSRLRDTLFVPLDNSDRTANITDEELAGLVDTVTLETPTRTPAAQATSSSAVTSPVAISAMNGSKTRSPPPSDLMGAATPRSTAPFALGANIISEGPMTPRNNAGPYVLDGRAGREMPVMESLTGTVMSDQDELELARARSGS